MTRRPSERLDSRESISLPPALTIEEAAEIAGVNERTIRRWIKGGELDALTIGRVVRISPAALNGLLHPSSVQAVAEIQSGTGKRDHHNFGEED